MPCIQRDQLSQLNDASRFDNLSCLSIKALTVGPSRPLLGASQVWKHQYCAHVLPNHHADGWTFGTWQRLLDAGWRLTHGLLDRPLDIFCSQHCSHHKLLHCFTILSPGTPAASINGFEPSLRLCYGHDHDHAEGPVLVDTSYDDPNHRGVCLPLRWSASPKADF